MSRVPESEKECCCDKAGRVFEELKRMGDVRFQSDEREPGIKFTSSISSAMQKPLPHKWLLSGDKCLRNFKPQQIKDALATLRPNNLRMTIVSRDFLGELNQTEEWYGTKYRCEKIPDSLMESFEHAYLVTAEKRLSTLHLPHPNTFIPKDLNVRNKAAKTPSGPLLIREDDRARTWWMEEHFGVPKANIVLGLRIPLVNSSAKSQVQARLISNLIHDAFDQNPSSYNADLAGLWYKVYPDDRGLVLSFTGYISYLSVFLETIVKTMKDLDIEDHRFDIIKEQLTKRYDNFQMESPYIQVQRYHPWLIAESNVYTMKDLAAELPNIAVGDVRLFQQEMLAQAFIEVYANGNILPKVAFKLTKSVEEILNPGILPQDQWPVIRSLILPPGSNYVYTKTLKDPNNTNNCIEVWFYTGDRGDHGVRAKTFLIEQMMKEPAFDQLRTKQNLGYVVGTFAGDLSTNFGLHLIIQSEMTPEYLHSRIQTFLTKFGGALQKMTDEDFRKHKQSAAILLLAKKTLDEERTQHWHQIEGETYDFKSDSKDAAHIESLTKSEMRKFFDRHFHPYSTHRACLSVYLRAQRQAEESRKRQEEVQDQFPQTETTGAVEITDVSLFKANLLVCSGGHGIRDLSSFVDTKANIGESTGTEIIRLLTSGAE
ncbi:Metalloenzyme, LuxS/M16 peptidase-like protein [Ilyonectria sp. MPI-CAGE-AT-0026]|nr:Metalloenzyme, LuxS/M16 peptidase-like protein [Ilyonectria sp. MPI-CAGE-AT-0026]